MFVCEQTQIHYEHMNMDVHAYKSKLEIHLLFISTMWLIYKYKYE